MEKNTEVEATVQEAAPSAGEAPASASQEKSQGPDLSVSDLAGLKSIIEVATQRGAFKAGELEAVGKAFNRLSAFLDAVTTQKEA